MPCASFAKDCSCQTNLLDLFAKTSMELKFLCFAAAPPSKKDFRSLKRSFDAPFLLDWPQFCLKTWVMCHFTSAWQLIWAISDQFSKRESKVVTIISLIPVRRTHLSKSWILQVKASVLSHSWSPVPSLQLRPSRLFGQHWQAVGLPIGREGQLTWRRLLIGRRAEMRVSCLPAATEEAASPSSYPETHTLLLPLRHHCPSRAPEACICVKLITANKQKNK